MSRRYAIHIEVENVTKNEFHALKEEYETYLDCDWSSIGPPIKKGTYNAFSSGETDLCGGMSEEEYLQETSYDIWKLLGRYVKVNINFTFLEDLPVISYETDEEMYNQFIEENEK